MTRAKILLGLFVIFVLTAASGMAHRFLNSGLMSQAKIEELSAQLKTLPEQIGDWTLTSEVPLDKNAERLLNCHGYVNQVYWNPKTGTSISVAVLFGPRGPIAVHTPDICYSGQGRIMLGERTQISIPSSDLPDTLWKTQFGQAGDTTPSLEVWYAWSDGGPWSASKYPRFWLTDHLYKIQVAGDPASSDSPGDCRNFLDYFLPELRAKLRR